MRWKPQATELREAWAPLALRLQSYAAHVVAAAAAYDREAEKLQREREQLTAECARAGIVAAVPAS